MAIRKPIEEIVLESCWGIWPMRNYISTPDYVDGKFLGKSLKHSESYYAGFRLKDGTLKLYFDKPITEKEKEIYKNIFTRIDKNLNFQFLLLNIKEEKEF